MIRTSQLDNGLHVITRAMPGLRSAALGIWLHNGVRHEQAHEAGYAHLMEHVLFKGTDGLDALGLARRFECMGGQINAHTGRELTALHGLVPGEHLLELLGLFSAMLLEPRFDAADLEIEREVVLQEMAMVEDTPEEAIEERATALVWAGHPLARPILGTRDSIDQVTADALHAYLRKLLSGERIWVVAAGAVDHNALVAACRTLATLPSSPAMTLSPPQTGGIDQNLIAFESLHSNPLPEGGRRKTLLPPSSFMPRGYSQGEGRDGGGRLSVSAKRQGRTMHSTPSPALPLPGGGRFATPSEGKGTHAAPVFVSKDLDEKHHGAQAHLIWSLPSSGAADPNYPARLLANHLLGGGVSSRLFQEVREKRGLVYGIHSRLDLYSDTGLWQIQTACEPHHREACQAAVEDSVQGLIAKGPDKDELEEARQHLLAALSLEEDSPEAVMERMARESIYLGRHPDIEERRAQLQAVDAATVQTLLANAWSQGSRLVWRP